MRTDGTLESIRNAMRGRFPGASRCIFCIRDFGLSDHLVPVADACLVRQLDLNVPLRFGDVLVKYTVDVSITPVPVVEHGAGEHGRIFTGLSADLKRLSRKGLLFRRI